MNYIQTEIEGVWLIEPKVFIDERGYFMEAFKQEEFKANIGNINFIQDNESKSSFGVLRGLHYQKNEFSQAKLVRVIKGEVFDVAVDLRQSSPTFGKYVGVLLSEDNKRQFFIPRGFAHGFVVLSKEAIFTYKVDNTYAPQAEASIMYNDKTLNIDWPLAESEMILSQKDRQGMLCILNKDDVNITDMRIAIVGTGYVGLVTGTCFAEIGVDVTCVDTNEQKIEMLKRGIIPIYENGLEEMVLRNMKAKRLNFTTSLESCLDDVEVVFSAVGTPPDEDGSADLSYVLEVARTIGRNMKQYKLVVTKSTVPVGTARKVRAVIQEELDRRGVHIEFDVASNPEFLKEGNAINDFMSPDRVVVGVESERAEKLMTKLYKPFLLNNFRVLFMDIPSAEMTKYAANSMLATRISFMNDIANLCELVGADVNMVRSGIGSDTRIGRKFLYPGIGYGGSCFPKDVKALIKTAEQNGYVMRVLQAVEEVNESQKGALFDKLYKLFNGNLKGTKIALWGLAFKPETDDMREAPSLILIDKLLKAGCHIRAYDPAAMEECKRRIGDVIYYARDMYDTLLDVDALMLVTEWKEFRLPSWAVIKKTMARPIVLDGRNIYDKKEMEDLGFVYSCIGR